MKLSVIIPVYNTEEYLQQSIESVIRQTYKNIEVILLKLPTPVGVLNL